MLIHWSRWTRSRHNTAPVCLRLPLRFSHGFGHSRQFCRRKRAKQQVIEAADVSISSQSKIQGVPKKLPICKFSILDPYDILGPVWISSQFLEVLTRLRPIHANFAKGNKQNNRWMRRQMFLFGHNQRYSILYIPIMTFILSVIVQLKQYNDCKR